MSKRIYVLRLVLERMILNARSVEDHTSDRIEKMNTWEYIQKWGLKEKSFRIFMMGALVTVVAVAV